MDQKPPNNIPPIRVIQQPSSMKYYIGPRGIIFYILGMSKYLLDYIFSIYDRHKRKISLNMLKGFLGIKIDQKSRQI